MVERRHDTTDTDNYNKPVAVPEDYMCGSLNKDIEICDPYAGWYSIMGKIPMSARTA